MRIRIAAPALVASLLATAALAPTSSASAGAPATPAGHARLSGADVTGYIVFTYSPLRRSAGAQRGFEGPGDLRVIAPDGSGNWALTTGPANDFDGVFAPGSQQVAFSSDRANRKAGITDLYVIDVEGTGLKRLTFGADTGGASWSPDGQQLVVNDKKGLLVVSPLTGKSHRLLKTPRGSVDSSPVWSKDQSSVVFTRAVVEHGKTVSSSIWSVAMDGSGVQRLVGGSGALRFSSEPAMSSDGFTLAWVVQSKHGSKVMLGDLYYGTLDNVRTFASDKNEIFEGPTWAPDGSALAITRSSGNAKHGAELLILDFPTGSLNRLYTVATGQLSAPNWTD
jgi:Tol biopolymer transport system component